MRSTVLDHWRWCLKLSIPVEESCTEVWTRWLQDSSPPLTIREYSIFLSGLASADGEPRAVEMMQDVLRHYKLKRTTGSAEDETVFWNSVLSVYAKKSNTPGNAGEAIRILRQMKNPNDRSYSIVLEALACTASFDDEACNTAADLYSEMKPKTDRTAVTHGFVHLLRTHAKSSNANGAQLGLELLQGAVQDYLQLPDDNGPIPNQYAFAAVIAGFCQRSDFDMASRVIEQLQALHQRTGNDEHFLLSVDTFNQVLNAAPSVKLLQSFEKRDVISYNTVLTHLFKSKTDNRHQLSADLLAEMKGRGIQPNTTTYSTALQLTKDPRAAELLFQDFLAKTGNKPTLYIFNAMMLVWTNARNEYPEASARVQMYFDQLRGAFLSSRGKIRPTRRSYALLLRCLQGNGAASSRVLNIMYEDLLHHRNVHATPDRSIFHSVMDSWRQGVDQRNGEKSVLKVEALIRQMQHEHGSRGWDVKPNRGSFLILLKTMAEVGTETAAERAEDLLQFMHRSDDPFVRPDAMCYNSVINAWYKVGSNHTLRAQAIYQEMIRRWEDGDKAFEPHLFTYGLMLKVWASSTHPQAGEKAQEVYSQMKSRNDKKLVPGVWHVTTLMDAHAGCGNVEIVHDLLQNELQIDPQRIHYNTLLKAYARSSSAVDAPEQAASIMERMKDDQRPDAATYTNFLKILQNSNRPSAYEDSREVIKGMLELSRTGEASATPTAQTWTVILQTLFKNATMSLESKRLEVAWMEPHILQDDPNDEKNRATQYWIHQIRAHVEEKPNCDH